MSANKPQAIGTGESRSNRRELLRDGALLAGAGLLARSASAAVPRSAPNDYRSLVYINLPGGCDWINGFVPLTSAGYQDYATLRQGVAIPQADLLPIGSGLRGFHPSLPRVRDLYDADRLAMVSDVGNLIEPLTLAQYQAIAGGQVGSGLRVPPTLFSHSHQAHFWFTGHAPSASTVHTGWGGRLADVLAGMNSSTVLPPAFTVAGKNPWQVSASEATQPFALDPVGGAAVFDDVGAGTWPAWHASRRAAWRSIHERAHRRPLEAQFARSTVSTRDRLSVVRDALALSVGQIQTPYASSNTLAVQLRMVARMIFARQQLGMQRQIFFVSSGAWDTHGTQIPDHANLLADLDHALDSFYATTVELGVQDSVTSFVASEFGRTLATNGDGTDHGWGAMHLALGAHVDGGRVHGSLPVLQAGGPGDAGNVLFPTRSSEQFGATLATWMGATPSQLNTIFPNLVNFSTPDLGFMLP